ncbi:arylsulfatase [Sphingobium sp. Sx8-8]|uniref:arylsulfatase n=1 Tax=Sphingobium sp. Sx8-8 TaxID=2933617 RepID=UPI001F5622F2|nr:arylsulfatase [Sphingobium sp. Sx8-8]
MSSAPSPTRLLARLAGLALGSILIGPAASAAPGKDGRPNIIVIVTDDLAYSDLGAFGGEIGTPNLDALATSGARFTNFQVSPTCSPTRSMLLTGNDNHVAGVGNMAELLTDNQRGKPGYEGVLNQRVATVAERLRDAGYHTLLSGKWHLGAKPGQWPADRGFERSFALLGGGDNHFGRKGGFHSGGAYVEDRKPLTYPEGAYSTDYFTDNFLTLLDEAKADSRPFFGYLAYTAPHWPLQAPDRLIARYKGRYAEGYEVLRQRRFDRQKALGLIGDVSLGPLYGIKPWADLTPQEQAIEARKMEVYAAMIRSIDDNVGRIVAQLKRNGQFRNTIILFTSDNGAAGSAYDRVGTFDDGFSKMVADNYDNSLDNIGHANSLIWYGPGWGQAGTSPYLLFKIFSAQGGIRAPLFATGPGIRRGLVDGGLAHATDVAATALDFARQPADGHGLGPRGRALVEGVSWKSALAGDKTPLRGPDTPVGGELFGGRNITKGDYKALWLNDMARNIDDRLPTGRWLLFNIRTDPGETSDLAEREPQKLAELVTDWDAYARRVGVILPQGNAVGRIDTGHRGTDRK